MIVGRHDPETDGLIKLGMEQKRLVETGQMRIEDATALPEKSRVENGVVVLPPTPVFVAVAAGPVLIGTVGMVVAATTLVFLAIALTVAGVRSILLFQIYGVPVYAGLLVGLVSLILGVFIFWARDLRQWRWIAGLQILLATLGAVIAYFGTADPVSRVIVFLPAAVTVADGVSILRRAKTP